MQYHEIYKCMLADGMLTGHHWLLVLENPLVARSIPVGSGMTETKKQLREMISPRANHLN